MGVGGFFPSSTHQQSSKISQNICTKCLHLLDFSTQDEAKLILLKNFKMQDEGTFSREIMDEVFPKMLALIKPENNCLSKRQRSISVPNNNRIFAL